MELKKKPVLKNNTDNKKVSCGCGCMGNKRLSIPNEKKLIAKND
ncbi:hypothetical protein LCGC14_1712490 [marine sediment metagenome]|uniref:Uncharacterized protein n=1 Tax=marine sediment metagenome TaxID=412755 RepID=A0A0F9GTP7_9ZZZZ